MRVIVLTALLACTSGLSAAQTAEEMLGPVDLSTPESAVFSLMRGMYQGDTDMIDRVMLEDGVFRRVLPDGRVSQDGLPDWKEWVGTLEVGAAHEDLFAVRTEQFGNMATVWAPFVISVNGEIANCGVNTMTLAQTQGEWKIVFGMDTPAPKDTCHTFKATYPAP
ncbi:MAG: hypothetical protein Hens2KO_25620 [Henriciella sp.]